MVIYAKINTVKKTRMKPISQSSNNNEVSVKNYNIPTFISSKSKSFNRKKQGEDCNLNCLHLVT